MNDQALKELLDKYLSGELSDEEHARLEDWFAAKQMTGEDLFKEDAKDLEEDIAYSDALFQRIAGELDLPLKSQRRKWWAVAASILLIIGLGAAGYRYTMDQNGARSDARRQMVYQNALSALAVDSSSWKTIVNTSSVTKKLVMADGSKVSLYPVSELRYDSSLYNSRDRKLYLSGKGFFDVAREVSKPFIVYSRGISTMALGTAFTIDSYDKNKKIKINLIRGKVRIRKEPPTGAAKAAGADNTDNTGFKDIILQAGQYFAYDVEQGTTTRGQLADLIASSSKKAPRTDQNEAARPAAASPLVYDRAALSTVLQDMEAAYRIHIDYHKEDIKEIQFSGSITPEDSVQHILRKIGLLNDLQVTEMDKGRFRIDKMKNGSPR